MKKKQTPAERREDLEVGGAVMAARVLGLKLKPEEQELIGKLRSGMDGISRAINYLENLQRLMKDRKRTKKASPKQLDQVYRLARKRTVGFIRGWWALKDEDQQDLLDDIMQDEQFPVDMVELSDAAREKVELRALDAITDVEGEAARLLEKLK